MGMDIHIHSPSSFFHSSVGKSSLNKARSKRTVGMMSPNSGGRPVVCALHSGAAHAFSSPLVCGIIDAGLQGVIYSEIIRPLLT
jgi:hypothetical protein